MALIADIAQLDQVIEGLVAETGKSELDVLIEASAYYLAYLSTISGSIGTIKQLQADLKAYGYSQSDDEKTFMDSLSGLI